jgi:hypothetical protein
VIAAIVVLLAALLGGGHIEGAPAWPTPASSASTSSAGTANGSSAALSGSATSSPASDVVASIGTAIEGGNISQAVGLGSRYLAVRAPRGTLVRLCAARCVVMTSTDYGPSSKIRPPRIADVALGVWLRVCDKPASAGICSGSVEYLGKTPAPPPTDTDD